jgi:hypothetical protein
MSVGHLSLLVGESKQTISKEFCRLVAVPNEVFSLLFIRSGSMEKIVKLNNFEYLGLE